MVAKLVTITTANTDTDVIAVPTNKKLKIVGVLITNRNTSDATVEVWDGASATGELKLRVIVGPNESFAFNEVKPEFNTKIVVKSNLANIDVVIDYEEV